MQPTLPLVATIDLLEGFLLGLAGLFVVALVLFWLRPALPLIFKDRMYRLSVGMNSE